MSQTIQGRLVQGAGMMSRNEQRATSRLQSFHWISTLFAAAPRLGSAVFSLVQKRRAQE
jgi:hypothetical protein